MDDFMTKPLTKAALGDMLLKWLPPEKLDLLAEKPYNDIRLGAAENANQLNRMLKKSLEVLKSGKSSAVTAELHALKGALAVTGHEELASLAAELGVETCNKKLGNFVEELSKLSAELEIKEPQKQKNQSSKEHFAEIKQELIKTIEQFNRPRALEEINRALELDFGEKNNSLLELIKADIEDYDYDAATEKLLSL